MNAQPVAPRGDHLELRFVGDMGSLPAIESMVATYGSHAGLSTSTIESLKVAAKLACTCLILVSDPSGAPLTVSLHQAHAYVRIRIVVLGKLTADPLSDFSSRLLARLVDRVQRIHCERPPMDGDVVGLHLRIDT